jgi:hypothetical protein
MTMQIKTKEFNQMVGKEFKEKMNIGSDNISGDGRNYHCTLKAYTDEKTGKVFLVATEQEHGSAKIESYVMDFGDISEVINYYTYVSKNPAAKDIINKLNALLAEDKIDPFVIQNNHGHLIENEMQNNELLLAEDIPVMLNDDIDNNQDDMQYNDDMLVFDVEEYVNYDADC